MNITTTTAITATILLTNGILSYDTVAEDPQKASSAAEPNGVNAIRCAVESALQGFASFAKSDREEDENEQT